MFKVLNRLLKIHNSYKDHEYYGNIFRFFTHFIKLQFIVRMRGSFTFKWIENSYLTAWKSSTGITGNFYVGLMEPKEMKFLLAHLTQDDLFVDIGANLGAYTVLASKVIGCETVAFEPSQREFALLEKNISTNGISKIVQLEQCAVGDVNTELFLTKNKDTMNKVVYKSLGQSDTQLVNCITLDSYFASSELNYKNIFIKVDVEGFEYNVLLGAKKLLENDKVCCLLVEANGNYNDFNKTEDDIVNLLCSYGFVDSRAFFPSKSTTSANKLFLKRLDVRENQAACNYFIHPIKKRV